MNTFRTSTLAAICAGGAMFVSVLPAVADDTGVNIIYPPKLAPKPVVTDQNGTQPHEPAVVEIYISTNRPLYHYRVLSRREFVDRALFQNYVGFKKVYKGRRYPF